MQKTRCGLLALLGGVLLLVCSCGFDRTWRFQTDYFQIEVDRQGYIVHMQNITVHPYREFSPADRPSPLVSLYDSRKGCYYEPQKAQFDPDQQRFTLSYPNGSVAQVRFDTHDKYFKLTLEELEPRNGVDAIQWGSYHTNINNLLGEIIGVARDTSELVNYSIGVLALDDNTIGGTADVEGDAAPFQYIIHTPDTERFPLPDSLREGQAFSLGGDGVSDVAFYANKAPYYRIMYGNAAQVDSLGRIFLNYQSRDRRQPRQVCYSLIPHMQANIPNHIDVEPIPDADFIGSSVALWGSPDSTALLDVIQEVVLAEGLPHPTIGGKWIKDPAAYAPDVMTEGLQYDSIISYTKQMELPAIHAYDRGFLRPDRANEGFLDGRDQSRKPFPFASGNKSHREFAELAAAEGLMLGRVCITNSLAPGTLDASPMPSDSLCYQQKRILMQDLTPDDTLIIIDDPTYLEEIASWEGHCPELNMVKIGSELIHYLGVTEEAPYRLKNVTRGYWGTTPTAHQAQDTVYKLQVTINYGYEGIIPNLALQDEIAKYYAAVSKYSGVTLYDFDGQEFLFNNGHGYYSTKRFFRTLFEEAHRLGVPYIRFSGATLSEGSWHYQSVWNVGGGRNLYDLDTREWGSATSQGKDLRDVTYSNYFPVSFGGNFAIVDTSFAAQYEHIEALSVGYGATYFLKINQKQVEQCPQKEAIFRVIRTWERARRANAFPRAIRKRLMDGSLDWTLEEHADGLSWTLYRLEKGERVEAILLRAGDGQVRTCQADLVDYVNPIVGASTSTTAGKSAHGLGKTFPGSATPFGLVQLSPDTKTGGDNGPGYSWHHPTIEGFSFIHMSGIGWYGDFGNLLVTPTVGPLKTYVGDEKQPESGYRSRFSHDTEVAKAGYYAVTLDDYDVRVELTSAHRSGMIRMTFPQTDTARISLDLARRIGGSATEQYIKVLDDHTIQGWMRCTDKDGGWGNGDGHVNYTVYFYGQFSKPLQQYGVWSADLPQDMEGVKLQTLQDPAYQQACRDAKVLRGCSEQQGRHIGFFTEFPTTQGEQVLLKVGISFVSLEGAKQNLLSEIDHWDFGSVYAANRAAWRKALGCMEVEGSERDKTIFYTALYHTLIDPRDVSDVTGEYIAGDQRVHQNSQYLYRTIFSGWDVFRSQFPLQTLINPRIVNDEINSLISLAETSGKGYFPRWEIMNSYSGCMLGNPAVSVLTDAYHKGIRDWDVQKGFQYCLNSVEHTGNDRQLGYTPLDISRTLEYAYADWCVARLAETLGDTKRAKQYKAYARDYRNIWNPQTGWFGGRNADGTFGTWRGETAQDQYCTESNPLQQGWFVPHDVYGLIDLMGQERFVTKLTEFFDRSSADFLWNDYYNHPNEPVHHVPFLFPYAGKPWLTQKWSRQICQKAYGTDVMGLCGNEDVGQMSAWYVLAASGFHPVCPGDNLYILTSPVFDQVTLRLDPDFYSGKEFVVKAYHNSPNHPYIQSARLNGQPLDRAWLTHEEITQGGLLELEMGATPNEDFGCQQLPPAYCK